MLRTECPLCGRSNDSNSLVFNRDYNFCHSIVPFGNYDVFHCKTCGLSYAGNIVENMEQDEYYERMSKYEEIIVENDDRKRHGYDLTLKLIESCISKEDLLIDIGCAYGALLKLLKDNGYSNLIGVELSSSNANYAREQFGVTVFNDSLYHIEDKLIGKAKFAVLSGVLEHLVDINQCIRTCNEILDNNGFIFITVPDLNWFSGFSDLYKEFSSEHINYFNIHSLNQLLNRNGFVLKDFISDKTYIDEVEGGIMAVYSKNSAKCNLSVDDMENVGEIALQKYISNCEEYLSRVGRIAEDVVETEYYIWGVGSDAAMLYQSGILNVSQTAAAVDGNKNYHGWEAFGNIVEPPESLLEKEQLPIVITSNRSYRSIYNAIRDLGLNNKIINLFPDKANECIC